MASYKEILQEKKQQFLDLKQEEKNELEAVERLLHWKVLEDARAQIKATFADRRRDLREDPLYKSALLQNFNSNLFHLDENDWTMEEPKPHQLQEEPKPYQLQEEPKPDEHEYVGNMMVCPASLKMEILVLVVMVNMVRIILISWSWLNLILIRKLIQVRIVYLER